MGALEDFKQFCSAIGLQLEPWQDQVAQPMLELHEFLATFPRGNGKTTLTAAVCVFELLRSPHANIVLAAASREQAQIALDQATKIVQSDEYIADRVTVTRRELRTRTGIMKIISADSERALGLIPSLIVVDELGSHPDDRLYTALRTSLNKVDGARMVVISTAGTEPIGPLWTLEQRCLKLPHVRHEGPLTIAYGAGLGMVRYSLPEDRPLEDAVECNPASWMTAEKLEDVRQAVSRSAFERFQCNRWGAQAEAPWIPAEQWDACASDRKLRPRSDKGGEPIALGFDGSRSNDHTAIVGCTAREPYHVQLLRIWKPKEIGGRISVTEVEAAIRDLCEEYDVVEIAVDSNHWTHSFELLHEQGLPIVDFPQKSTQMAPETGALRQAVAAGLLTHDGDVELRTPILNAVERANGMIGKAGGDKSQRKIDAAVAAVMAYSAGRRFEFLVPMVAFR